LPALALFGGRQSTQEGIRLGARSLIGGGRHRLRGALVATEVALSVMLLAGATLLFQSLGRLMAVDAGFETRDRLTMELSLSGPRYADSGTVAPAWQQVLDAVRAVPGVRSAALASQIPLGGNVDLYGVHLEDRAGANPADDPYALRYAVTPDYLTTMGIPLVDGRAFTAADNQQAPPVVLLNEAAAARLFPAGQAIGKRFRMGGGDEGPWRTVVGIVGSTRHRSLDGATEMQVYVPTTQWGEESGLTLVVHTNVRSSSVVPPIRAALRGVTSDLAITKVATLERLVNTSTSDRRFALVLFSCFAAVALVLAAAGLFGVLSAAVVERTREIGVRSALGATSERILGMVVRQGMTFAAIGIAAGLVGMWGTARVIRTLLYEVGPTDPVVVGFVVLLPGAIALAASALPAWRAARVDPMIALRET
jgi:predicted permease